MFEAACGCPAGACCAMAVRPKKTKRVITKVIDFISFFLFLSLSYEVDASDEPSPALRHWPRACGRQCRPHRRPTPYPSAEWPIVDRGPAEPSLGWREFAHTLPRGASRTAQHVTGMAPAPGHPPRCIGLAARARCGAPGPSTHKPCASVRAHPGLFSA